MVILIILNDLKYFLNTAPTCLKHQYYWEVTSFLFSNFELSVGFHVGNTLGATILLPDMMLIMLGVLGRLLIVLRLNTSGMVMILSRKLMRDDRIDIMWVSLRVCFVLSRSCVMPS